MASSGLWSVSDVFMELCATKHYSQHLFLYLCIQSVKPFNAYSMGWLSCGSIAPKPLELASTEILVGRSKHFKTGDSVTNCLSETKLSI